MNKRGQFFLLAAVIVIAVVAGFIAVYNNASPHSSDQTLKSLSKEINYESSSVLNYATINSISETETEQTLNTMSKYYAKTNPSVGFLFVYSSISNVYFSVFNSSEINITVFYEGNLIQLDVNNKAVKPRTGNQILVETDPKNSINFNLPSGQSFKTVLVKYKEGEVYLIKPE